MQAVTPRRGYRRLTLCALAALAVVSGNAQAQSAVESALSKEGSRAQQAARAQQKVDAVHSETRKRIDEYKAIEKQIDGLQAYLEQLNLQIQDQSAELQSLQGSVAEVTVIERQITPLMLRMIDALEQFVSLDLPFLQAERSQRVEKLQQLMGRADVTVAEKFRAVMRAYETEIEYGNTIEAYRGTLMSEGAAREVDYLRIGRLAVFYQSLDGASYGRWNAEQNTWESLPASYGSQIQQGIRIARAQVAPDLIRLPLQTAEAAQ